MSRYTQNILVMAGFLLAALALAYLLPTSREPANVPRQVTDVDTLRTFRVMPDTTLKDSSSARMII